MQKATDSKNWLKEDGRVVKVDGEFAWVETQRTAGCDHCAAQSGCGTSALAKLFNLNNQTPLKVLNSVQAQVGEEVTLALDESQLLKHSFMAYGLPLIGLFVFALLLSTLAKGVESFSPGEIEITAIIGGFIGLFLGWWLTRYVYKPVYPELLKKPATT